MTWLAPLTDAERAAIQRRVDQQNHPDDPTACLNEWFEQFCCADAVGSADSKGVS